MEPHEAHRGSQNAAAPGREIAGKDRCAVGCHQEAAAAGEVILHGTECSLYYRLVSNPIISERSGPALEFLRLILAGLGYVASDMTLQREIERYRDGRLRRRKSIVEGDAPPGPLLKRPRGRPRAKV